MLRPIRSESWFRGSKVENYRHRTNRWTLMGLGLNLARLLVVSVILGSGILSFANSIVNYLQAAGRSGYIRQLIALVIIWCNSEISFQSTIVLLFIALYETFALTVVWITMNPHRDGYGLYDWFVSMTFLAPVAICSLFAARYCVNFLTLNCIMDRLNQDLRRQVRRFQRRMHVAAVEDISAYKFAAHAEHELGAHLDRLIIEYDKLYDLVMAIIEMYSPTIVLLLALDFVQVTFQMYMFYCDLTYVALRDDGLSEAISSIVSAMLSYIEIALMVVCTSKYTDEVQKSIRIMQLFGLDCQEDETHSKVYKLSSTFNRMHDDCTNYYFFPFNATFLSTVVVTASSYLILLIQTV
ncbi:uncharacterized protein LOC129742552 [Uranotaenia lowii]|uniref:uncharacterized protein LOC129742552 n=1 Tax=Uranotaenia lowii TaxID=190385 RepID=UPI002479E0F1|nr:uncharacterized protein LOC129742552 [Uranotaenia lowii]